MVDGAGMTKQELIFAHVRLTQAGAETITLKQLDDPPILGSWQTVIDYYRTTMAHRDVE